MTDYFNNLVREVHETAKEKGFWDAPRNEGELFMLIVSELGEALEAHRKGKFADWERFETNPGTHNFESDEQRFKTAFSICIKDTFEDELADVAIRIFDFMGSKSYSVEINPKITPYVTVGENLLFLTSKICDIWRDDVEIGVVIDLNFTLSILFAIAERHEINLKKHIEAKMKFNATRPRLHGKMY